MADLATDEDTLLFASLVNKSLTLAALIATGISSSQQIMTIDLSNAEELKKGDYNTSSPPQQEPAIEGTVGLMSSPGKPPPVDIEVQLEENVCISEDTDSSIDAEDDLMFVDIDNTLFDSVADSLSELAETLVMMKQVFLQTSHKDQEVLGDHILTLPRALEEYYALSFNIFELSQGLQIQDVLAHLYLTVLSNIEGWIDVSPSVCKYLACQGLLMQNINELLYFQKMPVESSEVLQSAVEVHLGIIYNCARNYPMPEYYYSRFPWADILSIWVTSSIPGIKITSKLLASMLECLNGEELKLMDMTEDDLSTLVSALSVAIQSLDMTAEAFGYRYSALELVTILQMLSCRQENFQRIAQPSLLVPVSLLIHKGDIREKVASLKLLWSLLEDQSIKESFLKFHEDVLSYVKGLSNNDDDLTLWSNGVLSVLHEPCLDANEGSHEECLLARIKCYYAVKNYSKCVQLCSDFSHTSELCLMKGLALYHIYQNRQRSLRKPHASANNDFFTKHRECYDLAREVVKILGSAKDNNCLKDHSKMLDFAMLDYLLETNKLKELKRCFLCLKKQDIHIQQKSRLKKNTSKEKVAQAMTTDTCATSSLDEEEKQKSEHTKIGIRASHLIPQLSLKRLVKEASCSVRSKNVLFGVFGTKSDDVMERTPGTCTRYMLCGQCEHIINTKGEQPFTSFFEALCHHTSCEQQFKYGPELYYFCVSLIFRTLCPSQDDYINTDEVYQLLQQCRAFLMAESPLDVIDFPSIYLLVCPINKKGCDKMMAKFLVESSVSYTSKLSLDCKPEELDTFESVFANFFIVKMGVVIVLVKFKPSARYAIADQFLVNCKGGIYIIPPNEMKRSVIPVGIWTVLDILYQVYQADLENVGAKDGDTMEASEASKKLVYDVGLEEIG